MDCSVIRSVCASHSVYKSFIESKLHFVSCYHLPKWSLSFLIAGQIIVVVAHEWKDI